MLNSKDKHKIISIQSNPRRKSNQIISSIDLLSELIEAKVTLNDIISDVLLGKSQDNFRSIMWKLSLQIIPLNDHTKWEEILKSKREEYYKKCKKYLSDDFIEYLYAEKENHKSDFFNKLTSNFNFSKSFLETINIIKLDVERTFQEIDLFRDKNVKESLARILYIWTIENQDVGYCQGMNEILGTLYYAMYPSNVLEIQNVNTDSNSFYFYLLNSEEFFEADLYHIYSELMRRDFKDLYNYQEIKNKENFKNGLVDGFELIDKTTLTLDEILNSQHSSLKKRINKIT